MATAIHDGLFAPDVIADPYAYFGRLREEDPVHWNAKYELWVLTRYDDVVWLVRHPERFSSEVFKRDPRPPYPPIPEADMELYSFVREFFGDFFIQRDRPSHTEMRAVVHGYFTPGAMEAWRPMVQAAVKDLLDEAEAKGGMDVMQDFATPLPVLVIAQMLGLPRQDRRFIRELAQKLLFIGRGDVNRMRPLTDGIKGLVEYLSPLVDDRLARPGDDLLSVLARGETSGAASAARAASSSRAAAGTPCGNEPPRLTPTIVGAVESRARPASSHGMTAHLWSATKRLVKGKVRGPLPRMKLFGR